MASNDSSSDSGEGNDALDAVLHETEIEEIGTCISNAISTETNAIVAAAENDSITDSSSLIMATATSLSKQIGTLVEGRISKIITDILTKGNDASTVVSQIMPIVDAMITRIEEKIECSQLYNAGLCLISSIQEIIMDYFSRLMAVVPGARQTLMIMN